MARVCGQCNQEVDEKAKFCSNCGSGQIVEANSSTAPTAVSADQVALVANPNPSNTNANPVKNPPVEQVVDSQPKQNSGVVEFPVGQQSNDASSQLQSMPEIKSQNTVVTPATTPIINNAQPFIPNNGVIDNNSFGGGAPAKPKRKKHGLKDSYMWALLGAGGVIILLLIILIIILLFSNHYDGNNQQNPGGNDGDTIRIGNSSFGYLSVPQQWKVFIDENAQNTIQYTDGAGWIVTLFATSNSVIAPKNWATNVANQLQNDGAKDVAMGENDVNSYHGYKVFGYYEESNTYLAAWFFEAEDGNTHYIAIEGPSRYDDNYDIVYTFSLKQ